MTMSTSSAPAETAYFTSASLTSRLVRPLGNAVATLATCTPLPFSSTAATWARSGYTQTAATIGAVGSAGSGRLALAHSARTLPGVSWPSSVVRSIMEMARSSAHCLAVVLMDRLASMAARASAPTRSTPGSPCRKPRNEACDQVTLCVTAVALMKVVTYPLLPHLAGYTPLRLPGMSVTLASMFACLDTDCSHRPPRRQCCETTARTPGTCGTLV